MVTQSEYIEGRGRRTESYSKGIRPGLEFSRLFELMGALIPGIKKPLPQPREVLQSRLEVMVFSSLPAGVWETLCTLPFFKRHLSYLATFDAMNPMCRQYLWESLPLYAAVDGPFWFERLQDSPDFDWSSDEPLEFVVGDRYAREPKHAVLFANEFDRLYFEKAARFSKFPPDLPPAPALVVPRDDPAVAALEALTRSGGTPRISLVDVRNAKGGVRLPPIGNRYPDPMEVLRKVESYCLAPKHADQKWTGFDAAGYALARADDAYLLSASISSALLFEPEILDARTTADQHVQFGVEVALPTRRGAYMRVSSAWVLGEESRPFLATAFVSSGGEVELSRTMSLPATALEGFPSTYQWILAESETYAAKRSGDGLSAAGIVWIRHDHQRSRDFAAWLRQTTSSAHGVFTRRGWGGRVTSWPLYAEDAAAIEARLAFVQHALLLAGIRSHPELIWN